jgi:hypothetical protein
VGTVGALGFTAYTLRRQVDRERRADDDQRRMYAKRVSLSIVEEPLRMAEVVNGSPDNIYMEGYSKPHVSEKKNSPRAASYASR